MYNLYYISSKKWAENGNFRGQYFLRLSLEFNIILTLNVDWVKGHIFTCWCSFACNKLSQNHLNSFSRVPCDHKYQLWAKFFSKYFNIYELCVLLAYRRVVLKLIKRTFSTCDLENTRKKTEFSPHRNQSKSCVVETVWFDCFCIKPQS